MRSRGTSSSIARVIADSRGGAGVMGMGSDVTAAAKVSMMVFAFSLLCKPVDVAGGHGSDGT
jgi:hypothetical protein